MLAGIEREFELPLRACWELEAAAAARMAPWSGREQEPEGSSESIADQIVSLELARSTKTFRGTVALCRSGYGEQAAMLNRSLFEGMAVAHWVHSNATGAAERFSKAVRFDRHLTARLVERVGWQDEIEDDALEGARLEAGPLREMEKEFGKYGDRMWTGHQSLPKLVTAIEGQWDDPGRRMLWEFYEIVHRDNNQLLHSTVQGLRRAFSRSEEGGGVVWVGPSTVHVGQALFGAHWIYSQTLTLAAQRFEFKDVDDLSEMVLQHQYDFVDLTPQQVKGVGRNDECPCGSQRKYKHCHADQMEARVTRGPVGGRRG